MFDITKIQWADTTGNPMMGCGGCELFHSSGEVLVAIADAMNTADPGIKATKDNIWHLRNRFENAIREMHGPKVAKAADDAIRKAITCYAATLHLNKGSKRASLPQ